MEQHDGEQEASASASDRNESRAARTSVARHSRKNKKKASVSDAASEDSSLLGDGDAVSNSSSMKKKQKKKKHSKEGGRSDEEDDNISGGGGGDLAGNSTDVGSGVSRKKKKPGDSSRPGVTAVVISSQLEKEKAIDQQNHADLHNESHPSSQTQRNETSKKQKGPLVPVVPIPPDELSGNDSYASVDEMDADPQKDKKKKKTDNMEDLSARDIAFPTDPLQNRTVSAPGAFRQAPGTTQNPEDGADDIQENEREDTIFEEEFTEYATTPQGDPLITATLVVEGDEEGGGGEPSGENSIPTAATAPLDGGDNNENENQSGHRRRHNNILVDAKPLQSLHESKIRRNKRFWRLLIALLLLVVVAVVAVVVAVVVTGGGSSGGGNSESNENETPENETSGNDDENDSEDSPGSGDPSEPTFSPSHSVDPFLDDIENYQHLTFHYVEWGYFADDCRRIGGPVEYPTLYVRCYTPEGGADAYIEHADDSSDLTFCQHLSPYELYCSAYDEGDPQNIFFEYSAITHIICALPASSQPPEVELHVQVDPIYGEECGRRTTDDRFHSEITSGISGGFFCSDSGSFDTDLEFRRSSLPTCHQGSIINLRSDGNVPVDVCSSLQECINDSRCDVTTTGHMLTEPVLDSTCFLSKPNGTSFAAWNSEAMRDIVAHELWVPQFQEEVHLELSSFDDLP